MLPRLFDRKRESASRESAGQWPVSGSLFHSLCFLSYVLPFLCCVVDTILGCYRTAITHRHRKKGKTGGLLLLFLVVFSCFSFLVVVVRHLLLLSG